MKKLKARHTLERLLLKKLHEGQAEARKPFKTNKRLMLHIERALLRSKKNG